MNDYAYFVHSHSEVTLSKDQVDSYLEAVGKSALSFDDFVDHRLGMWCVRDTGTRTDINAKWCACPEWLKSFICKHGPAVGALFGLVGFSDVARALPVALEWPTPARPALERQRRLTTVDENHGCLVCRS